MTLQLTSIDRPDRVAELREAWLAASPKERALFALWLSGLTGLSARLFVPEALS